MYLDVTEARLAHLKKQLGYVRCWIDGFEAGGKRGPHAADALREVQLLLDSATAEPTKGKR